jgi:UPF0176 protein
MSTNFVNLGFYRFFDLETAQGDLHQLRSRLRPVMEKLKLQGTILLSSEGINAMLTGTRDAIDEFKLYSVQEFGISTSAFKEGPADSHSFNRLLIKVKREIIPIGDTEIKPHEQTAEYLPARELKKWLDEKRPLVLLDTRNDYEVETGTFRGALELGLGSSREFAARAKAALPELQNKTVVTFCTGGIRCEKASAALLKLGLKDVYQLEGGILRYFEENGAEHFDGNCFVFDWRLAVDGQLKAAPRASTENPQLGYGRHREIKPE